MKNVKNTILFGSVLAVIVITLLSGNTAFAYEPEDVENLTQRGEKVIDKIKDLENQEQTKRIEKKITKLNEELKAILQVVNEYGIYTYEQFEEVKIAQLQETPSIAQSSCGTCDPVLFFRAGFDWQMNTYFTGTTIASSWKILGTPGTSDISAAVQSPWWGTDWSKGFTQAFVDHGTTANIRVDMDVLNNGNLVKDSPM